jgi:hypothetical protein
MAMYREVQTVQPAAPVAARGDYGLNIVARIIYLVGGIAIALLAFRFVLALLGANPTNGFANFIYTTSHPLAAPFFGLFSYDQTLGRSRFELGTLIAIVVYALIMELLVRLVSLGSRRPLS